MPSIAHVPGTPKLNTHVQYMYKYKYKYSLRYKRRILQLRTAVSVIISAWGSAEFYLGRQRARHTLRQECYFWNSISDSRVSSTRYFFFFFLPPPDRSY